MGGAIEALNVLARLHWFDFVFSLAVFVTIQLFGICAAFIFLKTKSNFVPAYIYFIREIRATQRNSLLFSVASWVFFYRIL